MCLYIYIAHVYIYTKVLCYTLGSFLWPDRCESGCAVRISVLGISRRAYETHRAQQMNIWTCFKRFLFSSTFGVMCNNVLPPKFAPTKCASCFKWRQTNCFFCFFFCHDNRGMRAYIALEDAQDALPPLRMGRRGGGGGGQNRCVVGSWLWLPHFVSGVSKEKHVRVSRVRVVIVVVVVVVGQTRTLPRGGHVQTHEYVFVYVQYAKRNNATTCRPFSLFVVVLHNIINIEPERNERKRDRERVSEREQASEHLSICIIIISILYTCPFCLLFRLCLVSDLRIYIEKNARKVQLWRSVPMAAGKNAIANYKTTKKQTTTNMSRL